ncbi:MAG TPA: DMT family transporter [Terriglobia bacterium]|nr:DMT family transporter [Terriglobia bacterium]
MNSTTTGPVPAESPAAADPLASPVSVPPSHARMQLLMLFATIFWATNIVAGKEALRGFGPVALAELRALGAGLVLLAIALCSSRRSALRLSRREWPLMISIALAGVALNQLFFVVGLNRTSVAHTSLIVALGPIMVLILSCLLRLEGLTVLKLAGMLVSFAGVAVLTVGRAAHTNGAHWQGDLVVLASSTCFAVFTIQVKKVSHRYDPLTLNALVFSLAALLLIPIGAPAVLAVHWSTLSTTVWWSLAYMIVFGSVISYMIFAYSLTGLAASRVAAFNYLQPVIAIVLAIWLLAERPTKQAAVGGALILLGVYLAERERAGVAED